MSKKILLVEDQALIAMAEALLLKKHGYEVVSVNSGEKAIEAVDSDPDISLILMDIDLGMGIDGPEAAERILNRKDIPVVFLSSHTEPEVVERTERITSYGYVVKNSGATVLDASMKMAFKLFDAQLKEKEKEAKLIEREELMRYIIKHDPNAIAVYDTDLRYVAVSDRYLRDYQVKNDNILGMHHYEVFPEMPQRWKAIHQRVLQGKTVRNDDDWFERPDGSITYNRWECRPWYVADGSIGGMITYTEVTTERKEAEKALRDSYDLLTATQGIAGVGGWQWDIATDTVVWSEELYNITGLDPKSPPPQFNDDHYKLYTQESWQKLTAVVEHTLKTGIPYEIYAQIVRPDGDLRDVFIHGGSKLDHDGSISGLFGIVEDITDKKQREKRLKESEENLRITLNSIGDAVMSTDIDGAIVRINPVAANLCGWSIDEAKGKRLQEVFRIVHAATRETVENPVAKVLETGTVVGLANHTMLISRDGSEYQIADSAAPIRDDTGHTTGVVLVFRDVTAEYRVAQALADSERDMARAQAMAQLGSWRFELDSGIASGSDQARRIYGVGEGELTIQNIQSLTLSEDRPKLDTALKALVEEGIPYDVEFQIRRPSDNTVRSIHSIAEYDAEHHRIVGTIQDITERKQMEEALRENNKTTDQFFSESAAGAFFMMLDEPIEWNDSADKEKVLDYVFAHQSITQINKAMLDQYLAREEDFLGKTPNQLFAHDIEHGRSLWHKMFDQGFLSIDSDERRFDGSQLWIVGSYRCMYDERGRITGHFGTQHDITELKRVENELREALKEKDFLMREVNHRVKNSLSMVSSLISLKNSEKENDLSDIQHQIEAIGLIHEKLYQTASVAEISCPDYFGDLLSSIFSSFSRQRIRIEANIEEISVPTKSAVSLGLIVNEIATNAIKHGFSDAEEGVFSINMRRDEENRRYKLTLSNTGKPFPEGIEAESTETLGLRLINALVAQIDGTMVLQKSPHPVFTIVFPIEEE